MRPLMHFLPKARWCVSVLRASGVMFQHVPYRRSSICTLANGAPVGTRLFRTRLLTPNRQSCRPVLPKHQPEFLIIGISEASSM